MTEPFDPAHDEYLYHQRKEQEAAVAPAAPPVDTAVDKLLKRCRALTIEADRLDTALTIEYVRFREAMQAEFTWDEMDDLGLDITPYGVMLEPEDCTDEYFSFRFRDRAGMPEETRLPIAWLRTPEAYVAALRERIPVVRQTTHDHQVALAQRELSEAQKRLAQLTGGES